MRRTLVLICSWTLLCHTVSIRAQDRETKVRRDRAQVESDGFWIYNDLDQGIARARETRKPLLVVFRCIPCEACAQLDEQVVERDAAVRELLEQFVCVRIVHANGMDLSLFQFDYDQSWAAFFLNADRTIYGRYGTRSHETESEDDVSLESFAQALAAALELHAGYPANKSLFKSKRGADSPVKVPEDFAELRGKFSAKLDYEGKVVQSCIHCHQVGEAWRTYYRTAGKPIPDQVLFPYPNPKTLGLVMDPKHKARVLRVEPDSAAARHGFRAGDDVVSMAGQPILSIADMQWVLHNAGNALSLPVTFERNARHFNTDFRLDANWRSRGDISWRATSWDLRRMATGGLVLEDLSDAERTDAKLDTISMALRVQHVGQYGAHAAGKKAGFQKGDVVVSVDGRNRRTSESELLAYLVNQKKPGEQVRVSVLRGGKRLELSLPMQ